VLIVRVWPKATVAKTARETNADFIAKKKKTGTSLGIMRTKGKEQRRVVNDGPFIFMFVPVYVSAKDFKSA
jgi:hypothetical protein